MKLQTRDFLRFISIVFFFCTEAGASRFEGTGTSVSAYGKLEFNIVVDLDPEEPDPRSASMLKGEPIVSIGRLIKTNAETGASMTDVPLFITRAGDTKAWSLYGFYIERGYPATIKINTWKEEITFEILDSWESTWKTSGVLELEIL